MIKETQEATEAKTFLWGRYTSQTSVVLPFSESSDKGTHSSKPVEVLPCLLPPISQQVLYPFFSSQISQPSTGALPPDYDMPFRFHDAQLLPLKEFQGGSLGRILWYLCVQPTDELRREEEGLGAGRALPITDLLSFFPNNLAPSFLSYLKQQSWRQFENKSKQ